MNPAGHRDVGTLCIVLHSHLPWLAHSGAWPVGEEWLHQAWSASYVPVTSLLSRLAAEGRTDLLTLGVTPVLAAMLDDPYCLREHHTWLGFWSARAEGALGRGVSTASYEGSLAAGALRTFERGWVHGGSPVLRALVDSRAVELLGGPAAHPFAPLADPRIVAGQLAVGLDDALLRIGTRPEGIWAPECAYDPGLERIYAAAGVRRFIVDGPNVHGQTADVYDVASSGVLAFARDLEVTYRVWSPRSGYPGNRWYRDFHTFDHPSGLRASRVTSKRTAPEDKAPYDPLAAWAQVERDAQDFVGHVRTRLLDLRAQRNGRPGLVTVAYDTELFGHWWHEGPAWLERVLRLLPSAGVRVTTMRGALEHVDVLPRALPAGSWGRGKDWHVWSSEAAADLVALNTEVGERLLQVVDKRAGLERSPAQDQLAREAFLATQSDWAFCVTGRTAADFARSRAHLHADRFCRLADALESYDDERANRLAERWRVLDGPFGHLDARALTGAAGQVPDSMVASCAS